MSEQPKRQLPRPLRREIAALALQLRREYKSLFASDPLWRQGAGQFLTALLLPKPRRRRRPGRKDVTQAIRLKAKFRRLYPEERPEQWWKCIYPLVIPGYEEMSAVQQRDARERLRARVRWRRRTTRKALRIGPAERAG
jgi:hypothetical protein